MKTPKQTPKKKVAKKKVTKKVVKKTTKKTAKKTTKRVAKRKEIVITSPVNPDSKITIASELADDEMIERELMGDVLPYYIYQFCDKGCKPEQIESGECNHRKTTGMTVKGVNEVVRNLNKKKDSGVNIRLNPDHMKVEHNIEQDGEKGVQVSVYAENLVDGNSAWGIKFEPYKKSGKNGQYPNTFAVEKALSKAERNAKRKLIPETMAMKMVEKMLEHPNAVKGIEAPTNQQRVVTPPKPKPTTLDEIMQFIREAIHNSNDIDKVLEFDRRTQEDKRFSPEFKEEIRLLASNRVDQLQQ